MGRVLAAPDTTAARPALRLRVVGLCVIALFALLGLRLWALQVIDAPEAARAASANDIHSVPIPPVRGEILARDGHPLADDETVWQIDLSRTAAAQHPAVVGQLAALTGQTPAQIHQAVDSNQYSPYEPVPIVDAATPAELLYLEDHEDQFPGVSWSASSQRNYPQVEDAGSPADSEIGNLPNAPAGAVLGYVSSISATELKAEAGKGYQQGDLFGQSGLEAQYQSVLRGTPGTQDLEVDSHGNTVGTLATTPAKAGDDVVTNLDLPLQQYVDDALAAQIQTDRHTPDAADNNQLPPATDGAVVVMDPQGGQIFAMASYPSYDPQIWVNGISTADYGALSTNDDGTEVSALDDYAIQGLYTPGSTFKLNTATAALNTGLISATTPYDDNNTFTIPNCTEGCDLHNDEGDQPFGEIDISRALTVSSDDFFYHLGALFYGQSTAYGQTPIQDAAHGYGLDQLTGIDLPGEVEGRIDSKAVRAKLHQEAPKFFGSPTWYTRDEVEMAFGQGETVITPIGQAVAYSTFANGGTRYAPEVAAAIVSPSGQVVKRFAPKVTGHVDLPPSTRGPMLTGFEGVMQPGGTGADAFAGNAFDTTELAGKTGTATTNKSEPTSWFVGWGPVSDPEYVVVCVIDQGGYGAAASAPVVASIFGYLAGHPVATAPAIPPPPSAAHDDTPVTTTTPTTTTTTQPGPGGSPATTSASAPGTTGTTTATSQGTPPSG